MTVNTTKITGFVVLPDDTVREKSKVIFRMTGFDTDEDDSATVVPFPIEADIAQDGSIDVDLWPNPEGVRSTFYQVRVALFNGVRPVNVDIGKIEVPISGGPFSLNELLDETATGFITNIVRLTQAAYDAIIPDSDTFYFIVDA